MSKPFAAGLMWFRRDLRAADNAALHHALRACQRVHAVFVFDRDILDPLPRADRRVEFIRESLVQLDEALRSLAGHPHAGLIVLHGPAATSVARLAHELGAQAVFANHDDEPAALERDARLRGALAERGIALHTYKDHLVFERNEILTQSGRPYTVFTPYKKAWLTRVDDFFLRSYPVERHAQALAPRPPAWQLPVPTLEALGFERTNLASLALAPGLQGGERLLQDFLPRQDRYADTRDFPAIKGPSYLGVHLRFGTVSIRSLARQAHAAAQAGSAGAATWLGELIWRDFYAQILANFPHVVGHSFKPEYDAIHWEHGATARERFAAWCEARTGYPLVDAAMRQLNQTGYMHNRLRMVTASFLIKDLGIDWRWGEAYFATHLNDFDLASNNGGWQWASSSGCDAQPYFRIFNPVSQSRKFDPEGRFIRRYLPELAALPVQALHEPWTAPPIDWESAGLVYGRDYPRPLVEHDAARRRTLERYAVVRRGVKPA